jgi:S-adenosylmethionine/arginine decarboxylase-like enzyme
LSTYWGYHLMLDCSGCSLDSITSKQVIKKFVSELVSAIDMTAVGDPWIERTAIGIPDKEGFSLYQLIVTSNISAHFVDQHRQIYLDVFSCKEFNQETVKHVVEKYFMPSRIKLNFLYRNADN